MFTLGQLKSAHSKVKSGADFPAYIKEIKALGVTQYETRVNDGSVDYCGTGKYKVKALSKYDALPIAGLVRPEEFKAGLKAHQEGKTNFLTFIQMCANTGIEKWLISMDKMTCTYFDRAGNEVLEEKIPG